MIIKELLEFVVNIAIFPIITIIYCLLLKERINLFLPGLRFINL